jgi:hypothetical protein
VFSQNYEDSVVDDKSQRELNRGEIAFSPKDFTNGKSKSQLAQSSNAKKHFSYVKQNSLKNNKEKRVDKLDFNFVNIKQGLFIPNQENVTQYLQAPERHSQQRFLESKKHSSNANFISPNHSVEDPKHQTKKSLSNGNKTE